MRVRSEETMNGCLPFSMPGADARVVCRKAEGVAVIDLIGPLVELPLRVLRYRIRELLDDGVKYFAINLAEVPWADSYGLHSLAGAYNLIQQAGGQIKFFAASERLIRTLKKLRLDTVFELFESEAAALSSFS